MRIMLVCTIAVLFLFILEFFGGRIVRGVFQFPVFSSMFLILVCVISLFNYFMGKKVKK